MWAGHIAVTGPIIEVLRFLLNAGSPAPQGLL